MKRLWYVDCTNTELGGFGLGVTFRFYLQSA